jgi:hypothetical protein
LELLESLFHKDFNRTVEIFYRALIFFDEEVNDWPVICNKEENLIFPGRPQHKAAFHENSRADSRA